MLGELFLIHNDEIMPYIKNPCKIDSLLSEIQTNDKETKMKTIENLSNLINKVPYIGQIINNHSFYNSNIPTLSLIQLLIDEYITLEQNETVDNNNEHLLYEGITLLINTTSNRKTYCQLIFNKMKKHFLTNNNEISSQHKQIIMKRLLKILMILYSPLHFSKENEPYTYFFFTIPNAVPLHINLKNCNNNLAYDFSNSLSFTTWIYLEQSCSVFPSIQTNENEDNYKLVSSILFSVQYRINETDINSISLVIDTSNILKAFHNDKEYCSYSNVEIPIQKWTQIKFKISYKHSSFIFLIDEDINVYSEKIDRSLISNATIESISLFNNFIGRVSAFIIGNEDYDAKSSIDKLIKTKEEHVYPYKNGIISKKEIEEIISKTGNPVCENVLCFCTPLYIEPTTYEIKDIITHTLYKFPYFPFNGYINFAYKRNNFIQQIHFQGGEFQLLPILEIFNKHKDDLLLHSDLIETFIKIIFNHDIEVLFLFAKNDVFKCIGVILSRFPKEIFNESRKMFSLIWAVLAKMSNVHSKQKEQSKQELKIIKMQQQEFLTEYFKSILLNVDIFWKYSPQNQEIAWNLLKGTFQENKDIIKQAFPVEAIINMILYYDNKKQNKYCCKTHYEIFVHNNDDEDYITLISREVKSFFLFLEEFIKDENTLSSTKISIFKILNLDISPCIQLLLLDIFINFLGSFSNSKSSQDMKISCDTIARFFQTEGMYTLLYLFRNNPLDIKRSIIELINITYITFGNLKIKEIMKYINQVIIYEHIKVPYINDDNDESHNDVELESYMDKTKSPYILLIEAFLYPGTGLYNGNKYKRNLSLVYSFVNESFIVIIELLTNIKNTQLIKAFSDFLQTFYSSLDPPRKQNVYMNHCQNNVFITWITETNFIFYLLKEHSSSKQNEQDLLDNIILYEKDKTKYESIYKNTLELICNYFSLFSFLYFYSHTIYNLTLYINNTCSHVYIVNMFNSISYYFQSRTIIPTSFKNNINNNDDNYFQFLDFTFLFFRYFITRKHDSQKMFDELSNLSNYTPQSFCLGIKKGYNGASLNEWKYTPTINQILHTYKSIWYQLIFVSSKKTSKDKTDLLQKSYEQLKLHGNEKFVLELVDLLKEMKLLYGGLFNKSFYSSLIKLIKYEFPKTSFTLLEVINSLFTGILTVLNVTKNPNEKREWIVEYQFFLIFVILLCINTNDELCYNAFKYNYCMLLDIYLQKKNTNKSFLLLIEECLINITLFINNLFKYNEKKPSKAEIQTFSNYIRPDAQDKTLIIQEFFDCLGQTYYHLDNCVKESPFYSIIPIKEFFLTKKDVIINNILNNSRAIKNAVTQFKIETQEKKLKEIYKEENNENENGFKMYEFHNKHNVGKRKIVLNDVNNDNNECMYSDNNVFKQVESEIKNVLVKQAVHIKTKENSVQEIKKIYIKKKKELFTWNGCWSDKEVFYRCSECDNNKNNIPSLKYKVLNHYTKNLMRPFLVPVIDVDYYLPSFSQYKVAHLFYKESTNPQNINKQIEEDLTETQLSNNNNNDQNETNISQTIYHTSLNFDEMFPLDNNIQSNESSTSLQHRTYYDLIFERTSKEICNLYKTKHNIDHFFNLSLHQDSTNKTFECCYVKQTHHIKGYLTLTSTHLLFSAENILRLKIEEPKEIEKYFDKDRQTCYGSAFVFHPKDKDFTHIKIPYANIISVLKRRYFLSFRALEIFTYSNKNYYFSLRSKESVSNVLKLIETHISNIKSPSLSIQKIKAAKRDIGICYISKEIKNEKTCNFMFDNFDNVLSYFKEGKISSFNFIMYINVIANRSYSDLSQYPVMPWIIFDGNIPKLPKITKPLPSSYRDLSLPIGMLDSSEQFRKESFICNFNSMVLDLREDYLLNKSSYAFQASSSTPSDEPIDYDEFNLPYSEIERIISAVQSSVSDLPRHQIPYYYGSHYSNPIYVTHFLVRLFPYSQTMIEMQGNRFDDPQRLFLSIGSTIQSTKSQKSDVRELCPEFYYLPEMFININNLNFGEFIGPNNELMRVNDVALPPWARGDKHYLVYKNRVAMEKQTCALGNWIQLIFGEYQKGQKAREKKNVFTYCSYDDYDISKLTLNDDEKHYAMRMAELGLTPLQVFVKAFDIKERKEDVITSHTKEGISFTEGIVLPYEINRYNNNNNIVYCQLNEGMLFTVCENGNVNTYAISKADNVKLYKQCLLDKLLPHKTLFSVYHPKQLKYLFICKGQFLLITGFADRSLILANLVKRESIYIIEPYMNVPNQLKGDNTIITCMECDNMEKFLYCGTQGGSILQFNVNIGSSTNILNITAKNSQSSFAIIEINTMILNSEKAVKYLSIENTLNIIGAISNDNYLNIYTIPNLKLIRSVIISPYISYFSFVESPLPCILMYDSNLHKIMTMGINTNNEIASRDICEDDFISPVLYQNCNFAQFLCYGCSNSNCIKIVKLPYLKETNKYVQIFKEDQDDIKHILVNTISLNAKNENYIMAISSQNKLSWLSSKSLNDQSNILNNENLNKLNG